jgi:MFS family permease
LQYAGGRMTSPAVVGVLEEEKESLAPPDAFGARQAGGGEVRLGGVVVGSPTVRQALLLSFWDGTFATVMVALTETFGIAAAVTLQAPSMAIALLGSTPLLLGALGQYFLPAFVDAHRARKKHVLVGVKMQGLLLLAAAASGFLAPSVAAWTYVALVALAGVSANVTTASWVSWMGDLVPAEIRSRHFAWRSRLFACVNLSCALLVGAVAKGYSAQNAPWSFFTGVFVCAGVFRLLSHQMLQRQYEPPVPASADRAAWRARPSRDFTRFCIGHAMVQGASAMSAPFFNVWYLRDLHFNYLTLAITSCCTIVGSIISLPVWGRLVDRIGSRSTLTIAGLLVGLVPLPYLHFTSHQAVWIFNIGGGVAWAGYNLVSFNYMLSASENRDRARLFAFASAVTGIVVFSMTLLGGFLATRLPVWFASPLQDLFLLSAVLRLLAFSVFFPRLREYTFESRQSEHPRESAQDLFNEMPGYRVGLGLLRNFFRAFRG